MLKNMIFSLLAASSFATASQAFENSANGVGSQTCKQGQTVVFDWGRVMADPDGPGIVAFLCESLQITQAEFDAAGLQFKEKRTAGVDIDDETFWLQFAEEKGIVLAEDWVQRYQAAILKFLHVNAEMYALVDELKAKEIPVALFSNVKERYAKPIRELGLYKPFDPCILSCDIGVEKPDPQAYLILLAALDLPGKAVLFFDDKLENIEAAKTLGIDAVLFQSPEQVRKALIERKLLN